MDPFHEDQAKGPRVLILILEVDVVVPQHLPGMPSARGLAQDFVERGGVVTVSHSSLSPPWQQSAKVDQYQSPP